jgi:hypothetical protein
MHATRPAKETNQGENEPRSSGQTSRLETPHGLRIRSITPAPALVAGHAHSYRKDLGTEAEELEDKPNLSCAVDAWDNDSFEPQTIGN